MIERFLFFSFLSISIQFIAQKEEAQVHIAALSSDDMFGRGYVKDGHIIASNYLANQFTNYGLKPIFENNFFQEFKIDVNTFPTEIEVILKDENLIPGKDYLLEPQSGSALGTYQFYRINIDSLNYYAEEFDLPINSAVVFDVSTINSVDTLLILKELKYKMAKSFPVFWLTNDKFTWSVASYELLNPIIHMRPEDLENHDHIYLNCNNKLIEGLITNNVIGELKGRKDKYIVFSAHYDHLGMMGSAIFPGANDNASGTSMLLSLAKSYAKKRPKYNMLFIGFGAEEAGIKGSYNFVNSPPIEMNKIKLVINLDIVGTGNEGIAIVNAKEQEGKVKKLISINNSKKLFNKIKIRGQAANSDHYWFSNKGVPAIFIYTLGGIKAYHDVYDIYTTLPLDKYNDLYVLLKNFVKKI
jgi:aminopeptidase YwaD